MVGSSECGTLTPFFFLAGLTALDNFLCDCEVSLGSTTRWELKREICHEKVWRSFVAALNRYNLSEIYDSYQRKQIQAYIRPVIQNPLQSIFVE